MSFHIKKYLLLRRGGGGGGNRACCYTAVTVTAAKSSVLYMVSINSSTVPLPKRPSVTRRKKGLIVLEADGCNNNPRLFIIDSANGSPK